MSDNEEPRENGADALSLLSEARGHYKVTLDLLQAHIGHLRKNGTGDAGQIRKAVNDFSSAVALLLHELHKMDKQNAKELQGNGGEAYDFAALRSEIGGRLARLRTAASSGDFSGLSE